MLYLLWLSVIILTEAENRMGDSGSGGIVEWGDIDEIFPSILMILMKLSVIRWIRSRDLMYSMVTVINKSKSLVFLAGKIKTKRKALTLWGDRYVN